MDGVQLENGYTRIANEILENIAKVKLSPTQHSLIYVIWRYTYGFKRKEHNMSLSFLAEATGCYFRNIQKELKRLEGKRIIRQTFIKNRRTIAFNKNYSEWVQDIVETDNVQINNVETDNCLNEQSNIVQTDNINIVQTDNQERKKENIKEMRINDFFESLWSFYPNKKGKQKVSTKQKKKLFNEYGEEKLKAAICKYSESVKDTDPKYIMHGSTFFNGGFLDYLPAETPNAQEIPKRGNVVVMTVEELEEFNNDLLRKSIDKPEQETT